MIDTLRLPCNFSAWPKKGAHIFYSLNGKLGQTWRLVLGLFLVLAFVPLAIVLVKVQDKSPISKLSDYRGFSRTIYDEWVRISQYITVRDGTLLAVDIFRPVQNGQPVRDPLPVIWTHDRYHRADVQDNSWEKWLNRIPGLETLIEYGYINGGDELKTQLDEQPWLQTILKHGYVIGVVDVRGGGASFGRREGPFTRIEAWDAYDITEWFAAQPWSNGQIGMFGRSYLGITQYMAASSAPPHLKAIFPEMAMFDLYSFIYPGGVFHDDFLDEWSYLVKESDRSRFIAPVDIDNESIRLAEAIEEHRLNRNVFEMFELLPFRNSRDQETGRMPYFEQSPSHYLREVNESGVAVYHLAGWQDMWPRDALTWFNNLDNPQKIVIGPWSHNGHSGFDLATEHLRWYDYWLKGIDNGIMNEVPIYYYTMGAPKDTAWRSTSKWPLPNEKPSQYYFHNGPSGSVNSINDGVLSTQPPSSGNGQDDYTVDYTATSGTTTRWTNGYGGKFGYPDMSPNDEKGLTYTTSVLNSDVEVTGHPVIHLWVTSTAKDGDFFVYLEEVDKNGYSHYITEGTLRASHRTITDPPFEYMALPYHQSFAEDEAVLPSEPVKLVFDLHPTSNIFDRGNRIRVTITGADIDNARTPELSPPPRLTLYHNANYISYITLPIIPEATEKTEVNLAPNIGAAIP